MRENERESRRKAKHPLVGFLPVGGTTQSFPIPLRPAKARDWFLSNESLGSKGTDEGGEGGVVKCKM